MDFKGSMVLKACLAEAGYSEDTRHTIDIDANWHSETVPSPKEMTDSIQNALDRHGLNLDVVNNRAYGEGRSAGFKVYDRSTDDVLFTMDMDVNRPSLPARIYEVSGLKFSGASPAQIITDKISAISKRFDNKLLEMFNLYNDKIAYNNAAGIPQIVIVMPISEIIKSGLIEFEKGKATEILKIL